MVCIGKSKIVTWRDFSERFESLTGDADFKQIRIASASCKVNLHTAWAKKGKRRWKKLGTPAFLSRCNTQIYALVNVLGNPASFFLTPENTRGSTVNDRSK